MIVEKLKSLNACGEAIRWVEEQTDQTFQALWSACRRADWMLWIAAKMLNRRLVVTACCACARTALRYGETGDDRPRLAIEAAEAWVRREATVGQVRAAAGVAARSAEAAGVAARSAGSAEAAGAARSAEAAARTKHLATMADLVRSIIPASAFEGKF